MKSTVYIETTIPSFYYETRDSAEFVAMKNWTRQWWNTRRSFFTCFSSIAVLDELEDGNHPKKKEKIHLLDAIDFLDINNSIEEIVGVYIANYLMPKDTVGDAMHLAIASFYKMDFLLTWNCNHLANANKKKHIRRINERLRISTPEIITPLEIMEG